MNIFPVDSEIIIERVKHKHETLLATRERTRTIIENIERDAKELENETVNGELANWFKGCAMLNFTPYTHYQLNPNQQDTTIDHYTKKPRISWINYCSTMSALICKYNK